MAKRRGRREAEGAEEGQVPLCSGVRVPIATAPKNITSSASSAPRRPLRFAMVVLIAALMLAASAGAQKPTEADSTLTIAFLDVGQGDATWIILGSGKQALIDAGGSTRAIAPRLSENPRDTMDLLIATHAHEDHIGGIPWVLRRYVVRAYMDNGVPHTSDTYREVGRRLEREEGMLYLEAKERTVTLGGATFRILPPPRVDADQNENSVGVLIEFGKFRALFTGDAEERELGRWLADKRIPQVHVLKASHHGADNGYNPDLAAAAKPRAVVISAGKENGYRHPSAAVVDAWTRSGAAIYSTATHGTVFIVAKRDGTYRVELTPDQVRSRD